MKSKTFQPAFGIIVLLLILLTTVRSYSHAQGYTKSIRASWPHMPYIDWEPGAEYADSVRMFQGIPSVAVTTGGRIWATWYGGGRAEGPENYVMLSSSADGGKTWSDFEMVIDPPYRASEPALWIDPEGKMWFMWNQYPLHLRSRGAQLWAMTTENPDESSPKWSAPRLLALELNNFNKPTVLSDGTWIWPSGSWQFGELPDQIPQPLGNLSQPLISTDNGKTFFSGGFIPIKQEYRAFEEYQIVEKNDGALWLLTRTRRAGFGNGIGESFSHDGGLTWTEVAPSPIQHTQSRFFITRLRSGRLLLVKNGPIDKHITRSHMMAFLSDDDGESWYGELMLDEREMVSYPDGMQADDGQIYVIYDRSRHNEKEILLAVFTEDDVARGYGNPETSDFKIIVNKASGFNYRYHFPMDNADGAPFISGNKPVLQFHGTKVLVDKGTRLFNDLNHQWEEVPDALAGKDFIRLDSNGGDIEVRQAGMVYVITPISPRENSGLDKILIEQGFVKCNIPEFALIRGPSHVCSVFQKSVHTGDIIHINGFGVVVF